MNNFEEEMIAPMGELDDDMLENVSGGVSIGDVVNIQSYNINYCQCGRLLQNYQASLKVDVGKSKLTRYKRTHKCLNATGAIDSTILEGKTLYWVTRSCCGWKSSVIETSIV